MQGQHLRAPSLAQLESYNVNLEGQPEVIYQPIYDFQVYPAAGVAELQFFSVPEGNGKTFDDTNMELAGALSVPKNLALTDIQVWFFPAAAPGTGPALGTTPGNNWNDVEAVLSSGNLRLEIGSKEYLVDAPLMKFPPQARLAGAAALSAATTTAATDIDNRIDYATGAGAIYSLVPFRLISQQKFDVRLRWQNGLVPTPSTSPGRIGVSLGGFEYRLAQ